MSLCDGAPVHTRLQVNSLFVTLRAMRVHARRRRAPRFPAPHFGVRTKSLSVVVSRPALPSPRANRRHSPSLVPMLLSGRRVYEMATRRSSPSTLSPATIVIRSTFPDIGAGITVSIFIADRTTSG